MKILLRCPNDFYVTVDGEYVQSFHENDLTVSQYCLAHNLPSRGPHLIFWEDLISDPDEIYKEFGLMSDKQMYDKYFKNVLIRNLGYDNVH